jgi:hypothetical protein
VGQFPVPVIRARIKVIRSLPGSGLSISILKSFGSCPSSYLYAPFGVAGRKVTDFVEMYEALLTIAKRVIFAVTAIAEEKVNWALRPSF